MIKISKKRVECYSKEFEDLDMEVREFVAALLQAEQEALDAGATFVNVELDWEGYEQADVWVTGTREETDEELAEREEEQRERKLAKEAADKRKKEATLNYDRALREFCKAKRELAQAEKGKYNSYLE